jgi:hypothetical protein
VPNIEMHIYGNGRHPGDRMSGGLTDRNDIPFGTWQFRFIDWFRDLGFLQKAGVETRAAQDVDAYVKQPPHRRIRLGGGGPGRGANSYRTNAPANTTGVAPQSVPRGNQ